jgi:hypothetical protein
MKLGEGRGTALELDAIGYQFPDITESDYFLDSNWLIIRGRVEHPRGAWSFDRPCLTTFEVERLARWLEAIIQGLSYPYVASFIEPNLEFSYITSPQAAIQIRLTRECAPPWLADRNQRSEGIVVNFPVNENDLRANAGRLQEWLSRYPARASRSDVAAPSTGLTFSRHAAALLRRRRDAPQEDA